MYDHSRSNVPIDVSTAVTAVATFVEGFCGYLPTLRALLGVPRGSTRTKGRKSARLNLTLMKAAPYVRPPLPLLLGRSLRPHAGRLRPPPCPPHQRGRSERYGC